jgi:transposase-like protein
MADARQHPLGGGPARHAGAARGEIPEAIQSLRHHQEQLPTDFGLPAEHRLHLRSTNPIDPTFATVRVRERVTKGTGSRRVGLTVAFKLLMMAQARWRRLNAPF